MHSGGFHLDTEQIKKEEEEEESAPDAIFREEDGVRIQIQSSVLIDQGALCRIIWPKATGGRVFFIKNQIIAKLFLMDDKHSALICDTWKSLWISRISSLFIPPTSSGKYF